MFGSFVKIKIERQLFERLKRQSKRAGYSSVNEMIRHVLEREVPDDESGSNQQEVEQRLRGLGYIE